MNWKWKLGLIAAAVAYCVWALLPSLQFYTKTEEERARLEPEKRAKYVEHALKLGLDLQGGMHVVLEVDDSKLDDNAKKDAVDRAMKLSLIHISEPTRPY